MNVALIGNQNSGKTSLFNKLTGLNQKVGNWPGVTVERKEGIIRGTNITLVDLPGVYSLSPYTKEENISRDYLLQQKPDLVINVVDSTALERSLFLTTQLMDLGLDVVLALNMCDILEKKNIELDEKKLSKRLGLGAVRVSAKTGQGIDEIIEKIKFKKTQNASKNVEIYPKIVEKELNNAKNDNLISKFEIIENIVGYENSAKITNVLHAKNVLSKIYGENLEEVFANERYNFISSVRDECYIKRPTKEGFSEKLDKVFLNRWLAVPIFIVVMTLVYYLAIGVVGGLTTGLIDLGFEKFSGWIQTKLLKIKVSKWLVSLICDGIIAGVGSVLSFLPELMVIFLCISFLETTGYMSRISFMFDKIFRGVGLSGKSLVPFIVGTGCSVPAISSTRTIEQSSEREMTIVLAPFVPCSAKLPIIALFVGYFFPNNSGLVTAFLYFLSIAIIMISAWLMKKFIFKSNKTSFISELPEYKVPSGKYILRDVFDKTKDFVVRAGTIILTCSVFVWFLSSFEWNLRFSQNIEHSILAWIGDKISWFFYPIVGKRNWAVSVSAIQGLIAKEQVVSSMNIISGLSGTLSESIFTSGIFSFFNKANAFSFMLFNLFSAPCVASIGAMKNELKEKRKTILAVIFQIMLAWILSSLSYFVLSKIRRV